MSPDLQPLCELVNALPHCQKAGIIVDSLSQGAGRAHVHATPSHNRDRNNHLIHNGILTTLADTLCGTVASTGFNPVCIVSTLTLRTDYLHPAISGHPIYAAATCEGVYGDVATVSAVLWQEDPDQPIARTVGSFVANR